MYYTAYGRAKKTPFYTRKLWGFILSPSLPKSTQTTTAINVTVIISDEPGRINYAVDRHVTNSNQT
uniref:Uncharacterized protein n=1 Tax=Octopus bimaculoides TaxID=37653 RepID=A0A0L8GAU3_OCTBM